MSAYRPSDPALVVLMGAILAAVLLTGLVLTRLPPGRATGALAWTITAGIVLLIHRSFSAEPPGFRMLALIAGLLYAMKSVVTIAWRRDGDPPLTPLRWLAFAAAWPGMRPSEFRGLGGPAVAGARRSIGQGVGWLVAGLSLVALARLAWLRTGDRTLVTLALLPGLSLVLHFGLFNLATGVWRSLGADCRTGFRAPLRSTSLREFWSGRWNVAFSEMTAVAVHQPVTRRLGRAAGVVASFAFSGVLHEIAISLPVRAGFGLPLLYFLLHGGLVLVESALARSGHPVDGRPWLGRVWTVAWLVAPLPLLFHRPFLAGVVWPIVIEVG